MPFGCGATVYYNYADLRLRNPFPYPVAFRLYVENGALHGEVRAAAPAQYKHHVEQTDHKFERRDDGWFRANVLWRVSTDAKGNLVRRELLSRNVARCLYVPNGDRLLEAKASQPLPLPPPAR